jgi:hypothetical protein
MKAKSLAFLLLAASILPMYQANAAVKAATVAHVGDQCLRARGPGCEQDAGSEQEGADHGVSSFEGPVTSMRIE